jgi:integrase/recombinase XerD
MITIYTRHTSDCPKKDDRYWKRCRCPKWIYGSELSPTRQSAGTRSWERAEKFARESEDTGPERVTVSKAITDYLSDKKVQNISDEWYDKLNYELTDVLLPWCEKHGYSGLDELDLDRIKAFRKTWTGNALTLSKKQERFRSFFKYCHDQGWIAENTAKKLSRIKVDAVPTDFFTPEEFAKILAAVDVYHSRGATERGRRRARAMLLLLRWSGLRIGDAARLERARIDSGGKLLLYMAKTREPVYVRLPDSVVEELKSVPNSNPRYFFWSGNGDRKTVVDDWWRTLSRVFAHANLGKRAHPHMMRDTFAVNFLVSGGTMDELQMLLGHKSIKTTEKHYAPWGKARQDKLDRAVKKSWG